ncbi:hypothetical protein PBY51_005010 [Eleginops maclovinus]|uniref:Uncharacterized protein n=1 Tax=Eleginops maclovinus TaxID=56733 RepID=A0AAN7X3K0_ELEMC|nr:hypothetical protein PBY51_005010 [Eleginops maclovinus]
MSDDKRKYLRDDTRNQTSLSARVLWEYKNHRGQRATGTAVCFHHKVIAERHGMRSTYNRGLFSKKLIQTHQPQPLSILRKAMMFKKSSFLRS